MYDVPEGMPDETRIGFNTIRRNKMNRPAQCDVLSGAVMNRNAQRDCELCGRSFPYPRDLKKHQARKRPCAPIVDRADLPDTDKKKPFQCRYCGRTFTTGTAVSRHVRNNCKIANSDEGMEKLVEHTLIRQLAEQTAKVDALQTQMTELASLLKNQLELVPAAAAAPGGENPPRIAVTGAGQVNLGPVQNTTNLDIRVSQQITIIPWDGDKRIDVGVDQIAAAFAENKLLKEYAAWGDHELADPDRAPPYVTELLMDLVKRGHANPATRNVYLNPRRADQVLVHLKSGTWEILPLANASRLLLDGVAQTIYRVTLSDTERVQLPLEAQNALALARMMYGGEPEAYVDRVRVPMSAHLANTAPGPAPDRRQ